MPRMSVIDASFFLFETPERPMHVSPLVVLQPPKGYRGNFADDLYDRLLERPVGEPFNYVAHLPRSGLLAKWEKLTSVDVKQHVTRLTAPSNRSIEDYACKLYEGLLDMSMPLWHFYVIDRKNDTQVYLFAKIHHSLFDGIGMVNLFGKSFSTQRNSSAVSAPWEGKERTSAKPKSASLTSAGMRLISNTARGAPSLLKGAASAWKMYFDQYLQSAGVVKIERGMANPFQSNDGYFKVVPEKGRTLSHCTLSLPQMKAISKHSGTSVNDIFMAVTDAAVSRILVERKVRMKRPLIAEMMMATQGDKGQSNNFSPVNIPLGLPKSNVLKRLLEIQRNTQVLKSTVKHLKTETMLMYSMPLNLAPVVLERLNVKNTRSFSDIFVSNPYGIAHQGYVMGARVEATLPLSAIVPGHVMNITGVSNVDKFVIGVACIKSVLSDPDQLTRYITDEFQTLGLLAGLEKPKKPVAKKTTTKAKRAPRYATPAKNAAKTVSKSAAKRKKPAVKRDR